MKIMVINGPSINMLGIREPGIYGSGSYGQLVEFIKTEAARMGVRVSCLQTNHEGQIIDWLQEAWFQKFDGVVLNPGAYTHTSIAIADAIRAIAPVPVVEVHISDTDSREDFRKVSFCAPHCIAQIKGKGFSGYIQAIEEIQKHA